jgi:hypothetical protein
MKADLTRDTFDPVRHFSRVLFQQGRVQLDADFNEQTAAFHHYLRCLALDLIGRHGGRGESFKIAPPDTETNFKITQGRYYINGLLCENNEDIFFGDQPAIDTVLQNGTEYFVFLHAWEQLVTCVQDRRVREVALGGPDTAARAKVVWQVKAVEISEASLPIDQIYLDIESILGWLKENITSTEDEIRAKLNKWSDEKGCVLRRTSQLRARAQVAGKSDEPCPTSPEARYRGPENQLYRVEVHTPGDADTATFKWSRDNGSAVFPIRSLTTSSGDASETTVELEHLGRDERTTIKEGDWVEIEDDHSVLKRVANPLLQVSAVDRIAMTVTLKESPPDNVGQVLPRHPLLRLWNHRAETKKGDLEFDKDSGTIVIKEEDVNKPNWLNLEDGIQIQFLKDKGPYCTGDYWLIPARTATGDVEWPGTIENPLPQPPHGVDHHLAPLAVVKISNNGNLTITDCRRVFKPLVELANT